MLALLDEDGTPLMTWSEADIQRDRELRRDRQRYDHAMSLASIAAAIEEAGGSDMAVERVNRAARAAWQRVESRAQSADARRRARCVRLPRRFSMRRSRSARRQRCAARRISRAGSSNDSDGPPRRRASLGVRSSDLFDVRADSRQGGRRKFSPLGSGHVGNRWPTLADIRRASTSLERRPEAQP